MKQEATVRWIWSLFSDIALACIAFPCKEQTSGLEIWEFLVPIEQKCQQILCCKLRTTNKLFDITFLS